MSRQQSPYFWDARNQTICLDGQCTLKCLWQEFLCHSPTQSSIIPVLIYRYYVKQTTFQSSPLILIIIVSSFPFLSHSTGVYILKRYKYFPTPNNSELWIFCHVFQGSPLWLLWKSEEYIHRTINQQIYRNYVHLDHLTVAVLFW